MFKKVKTALIGSGSISFVYMNTLVNGGFTIVDMVGCSDIIPERSKARAGVFGIRQMSNEEILSDPEIEIVLNTTQLWKHNEVTEMILNAGKHVYMEKAMGHTYEGAKANYELAKSRGLRLGCAPDCYMGAGLQTARKLIDDGIIGIPLYAQAMCMRGYNTHQRASNEPRNPEWLSSGVTITYDMAGYYVNALVSVLGPVNRVSGYTRFFEDRVFSNPQNPDYKQRVHKQTGATTLLGCLEFETGCYASLVLCQEGFGPEIPRVEIFGTEGTMKLTDPNNFGGQGDDIYVTRIGNSERFKMPFTHGFCDKEYVREQISGKPEPCANSWRGVAVVDMAWAIRRNRPHRSSAELALHTVEIVDAIDRCTIDNKVRVMESRPERPAPLAPGHINAEVSIDNI